MTDIKIFYVTLNNEHEAKNISRELLKERAAVCTNWFPINCSYLLENEINEEPEIVLIIKTKNFMREKIENIISNHINYTNFIGEINIESINRSFFSWINKELP